MLPLSAVGSTGRGNTLSLDQKMECSVEIAGVYDPEGAADHI